MGDIQKWKKFVPAAGVVLLSGCLEPVYGFFPRPSVSGEPPIANVVPPAPDPAIPIIPVPPPPPPPFVPPLPPTVTPDEKPPVVPPICICVPPERPQEIPEPATLISGLIGLGALAATARRRRKNYTDEMPG